MSGQVWLVTGAGRGIGREFVRQLLAAGQRVVATARSDAALTELRDAGVERAIALEVDDPASVAACARACEGLSVDVLVNNAGRYSRTPSLAELDPDDLLTDFRTNAVGPVRVTQALLPTLRRGEGKRIAQITSKMGSIADNSSGGSYAYRASKSALNMLTKSMALDLAGEGFAVVLLHPGWVRTDMGSPNAPLSVEESVTGMLTVLGGVTRADSGCFFAFDGERLPW